MDDNLTLSEFTQNGILTSRHLCRFFPVFQHQQVYTKYTAINGVIGIEKMSQEILLEEKYPFCIFLKLSSQGDELACTYKSSKSLP
uniref:Uncharacterized protein n=1 Tax=Strongyloides venezuelensis TaxID=75913 RepID=A0A0K0G5G3_STRVS